MLHIRSATADDAATIRRVVRGARLDPTQLRWQNFLIAEVDGRLAGMGQVRQHRGCQELGSMVTLRPYRGRGVAGSLIAALEARAGRPLYLFCPAHRRMFYEQFGYRVVGWRDLPPALRLKYLLPALLRLAGLRVLAMMKA